MELDWGKRPPTSFVDSTIYIFFNQSSELKFRVPSSFGMRAGLNSSYLHPSFPIPPPLPTSHGLAGQGTPQVSMPIPFANGAQNSSGGEDVCPLKESSDHCNLGLSLGKPVPTCSVSLLGRQKVTSSSHGMDPFREKLWHEISTSVHHLFSSCPCHLTTQHCPACCWLLMSFSFLWPVSWIFSHHRRCLFQKHWH